MKFKFFLFSSVYSGHHSILVPPFEVEVNPCVWLATVSNYKVRDTFCSYSVMELCTKGLRSSVLDLKVRVVNHFFFILHFFLSLFLLQSKCFDLSNLLFINSLI